MEENQNKQAISGHLNAFICVMKQAARPKQPQNPMISYYQLMLDKGTWFIGRKLAKEYPATKAYKRSARPKIKQCFYNSQMFCVFNEVGAKYYEGYMCDNIAVVHHGWVVMPDGNVVDMTLEARDAFHKREGNVLDRGEPVAYLGVEVPLEFLKSKIGETRMCQPYAQCYYLGSDQYFTD